jgi:hypothetical protein
MGGIRKKYCVVCYSEWKSQRVRKQEGECVSAGESGGAVFGVGRLTVGDVIGCSMFISFRESFGEMSLCKFETIKVGITLFEILFDPKSSQCHAYGHCHDVCTD